MAIARPLIKLTYNSKDITKRIQQYLIDLTYIDRTEVESDEIEIILDDAEGKWYNAWYPDQGAKLDLEIGYEGEALLPCGNFEVDQVETIWNGGGRSVSIKALSVVMSKPLRTKREYAYEHTTLKKLAETVASRSRLTVSGKIESIQIERETQFEETDLAFLRRVSMEYNYIFSVKSGKLVFQKLADLQKKASVMTISAQDVSNLHIIDTTGRTFRVATQRHFDPYKGRSIAYKTDANGNEISQDEEVDEDYVENKQQAELKAKARIAKITDSQVRISLGISRGTTKLLAGNNIDLKGFGKRSGKYAIESSTHTITPDGGYSTQVELYSLDL